MKDINPHQHIPGVLKVYKPEGDIAPVIFDSPHSGAVYPDNFEYDCPQDMLIEAEDTLADHLFAHAPHYGIPLLCAEFPRSFIDPNRAIDDIDIDMIAGTWDRPVKPTKKSYQGIGLIRRLCKPGVPMYKDKLSAEDVARRIDDYYVPYYDALEGLMQDAYHRYGQFWHINCHSMNSSGAPVVKKQVMGIHRLKKADIVLGDHEGKSCDPEFTHEIKMFFENLGYSVVLNNPYQGVELTGKYSAPADGRHSLQLEINKALYLNEKTQELSSGYTHLKQDLEKFSQFCIDFANAHLIDLAAD